MSDQTITSLIEKLEGAEVGSRELDAAIFQFDPKRAATGYWFADEKPDANPVADHVPAVTTSLDAALALAERVVGGKETLLLLNDLLTREAEASDFDAITVSDLPRLLCAAILRAQSEARAAALKAMASIFSTRATGEDSPANEGEGR